MKFGANNMPSSSQLRTKMLNFHKIHRKIMPFEG